MDVNAHFAGKTIETDGTNVKPGKDYDMSWDYLSVSGNNTTKYGTGLSLTYAYKSNFSWKLFADYDFTRKHYTMELNDMEFTRVAWPDMYNLLSNIYKQDNPNINGITRTSTIKKNMNSIVLGCAFTVSF